MYNIRRFLVGFVVAESEENAIDVYTDDSFRKGFLSASECSEGETESKVLIGEIVANKIKLGVWA